MSVSTVFRLLIHLDFICKTKDMESIIVDAKTNVLTWSIEEDFALWQLSYHDAIYKAEILKTNL